MLRRRLASENLNNVKPHDCRRAKCNPAPKSIKISTPSNGLAFFTILSQKNEAYLIPENHIASGEFLL